MLLAKINRGGYKFSKCADKSRTRSRVRPRPRLRIEGSLLSRAEKV